MYLFISIFLQERMSGSIYWQYTVLGKNKHYYLEIKLIGENLC